MWTSLTPCYPPSLPSSPTILSSGLIQSILQGDCSREKDVAEANERIITTGSKRSGKSIPSGHDGFRMKQRKSKARQRGPCTNREGRDERADRVEEEKKDSHNVSISWRWPSHALLSDWCCARPLQLLCVLLFIHYSDLSHCLHPSFYWFFCLWESCEERQHKPINKSESGYILLYQHVPLISVEFISCSCHCSCTSSVRLMSPHNLIGLRSIFFCL